MERIATTELVAHAGERVRLAGWLERLRQLGSIDFLILRDGVGSAQVVIDSPELREQLAGLPAESVLAVEGPAVRAPQAPGGVELRAER
ncbi:MAG TPA: OB-fold nucleic acid binding domain-containing protein, partial [Nitrolancea sp.]|nr:OB-fold nucleic acid binding domain-containing protein [Nitrolancea sp.]